MFSIFKKKKTVTVDLSALEADMHSHLLPGIDDGSPDLATSLELIKGLQELGFQRLVTTPHILWDMYRNEAAGIQALLESLQGPVHENGLTVKLKAAAEYYLDEHFDSLLANDTPLLTIKDNWVLVEFSFVIAPIDLKQKLFNLQIKGYQPVLAHPERYNYLQNQKHLYDEFRDAGCLFQVNLLSLSGYYGKAPQELALYFLKKKYVDLLGTDLHHARHLNALRSSPQLMDHVHSLLDSGKLLNPGL